MADITRFIELEDGGAHMEMSLTRGEIQFLVQAGVISLLNKELDELHYDLDKHADDLEEVLRRYPEGGDID